MYGISDQTYRKGATLTREGRRGKYIYLIEKGSCLVEKNYEIEGLLNRKVIIKGKFKICNISKQCLWGCCSDCLGENTFIGEEILWSSDLSYKYTVKVVSDEAKVYQILRSKSYC